MRSFRILFTQNRKRDEDRCSYIKSKDFCSKAIAVNANVAGREQGLIYPSIRGSLKIDKKKEIKRKKAMNRQFTEAQARMMSKASGMREPLRYAPQNRQT